MQHHHAFLLYANSLKEAQIPDSYKLSSIDVHHIIIERFGIDDARELTQSAKLRPMNEEVQVFVIVTSELAIEAQNALLKLFEEPPQDSAFYLVIKKTTFILSTLRSRVLEEGNNIQKMDVTDNFDAFLNCDISTRLSTILSKTKEKDARWIEDILAGCERFASLEPIKMKELLASVVMVRSYSSARGASVKMLLEELALLLPV